MKLLFIFFSLLINIIPLNAQEPTNQLDEKGLKHGKWLGYYEDTKNLRYEGVFEHGIEQGIFNFYDNRTKKTLLATRDFTKGNGQVYTIFYNEKGLKVSEGLLINKKREGKWLYYHLNSTDVMTLEFYKNDQLNGLKQVFYKNNKIAEETNYILGKKEGLYKKYAENGVVLEEVTYKNDERNGTVIYRNTDNQIITKGFYVNDIKRGVWTTYENGKVVKEEKITSKYKKRN